MNKKTLKVLEWQEIIEKVKSYTKTPLGGKLCLNVNFMTSIEEIKKAQTLTTEAKGLLDKLLYPPLDNIFDIEQNVKNARNQTVLEEIDIFEIAKTMQTSRYLYNFLEKNAQNAPNLHNLGYFLFNNKNFEDEILQKFTPTAKIKEDATQNLKTLTQRYRDKTSNLKDILNTLLKELSPYLQENTVTMRDGRYVFAIKIEYKAHVKGIVHDVSSSGATIFVEPQRIVPLSNELKEIEINIQKEIKEILKELSILIKEYSAEILRTLEILANLDLIFAKANYSIEIKGIEPEITPEPIIILKGAKHPILVSMLEKVIPNDIEIGQNFDTLVITGSNTGGKTITLKTLGLFVLMARAGLQVSGFEAKIHPFLKIFADIGDEQNISQSLSTFSGHITNLRQILEEADNDSLILLDEIGVGTDPKEGAAFAQAVIEYLIKKGSKTIITTHYGELKILGFEKENIKNASVEFDPNTLKPTYKLNIGTPGSSNAISIAKNLGINDEIIQNATNIYFNLKDESSKLLEELEKTQIQLSLNNKIAEELKNETAKIKEEYEIRLQNLKEQKTKILSTYKRKFQAKIDNSRDEIKKIMQEIYAQKSEKLTRRAATRLNKVEGNLRQSFSEENELLAPQFKEIDWEKIKIGDNVLVKKLNQVGILNSLPDKNNNIMIQMGLIKTILKKDEIAVTNKKAVNTSIPKRNFQLKRRDVPHSISLRGIRVEEALDNLEKYLDDASIAGLNSVCIIHGHGMGVLKKAIRDYLKDSPYIKSYTAGEEAEGGDGVTIAIIK